MIDNLKKKFRQTYSYLYYYNYRLSSENDNHENILDLSYKQFI